MAAMKERMIEKMEAAEVEMQKVYEAFIQKKMDRIKERTRRPEKYFAGTTYGEMAEQAARLVQEATAWHIRMLTDADLLMDLVQSCESGEMNIELDYWDMLEEPGRYIPWENEEEKAD